jgi:hypothetical protein
LSRINFFGVKPKLKCPLFKGKSSSSLFSNRSEDVNEFHTTQIKRDTKDATLKRDLERNR